MPTHKHITSKGKTVEYVSTIDAAGNEVIVIPGGVQDEIDDGAEMETISGVTDERETHEVAYDHSSIASLGTDKADKVSGAVDGNLAGLNATGNLTDSGSAISDFASLGHSHANIFISPEMVATGGMQLIPHTLGSPPANIMVSMTDVTVGGSLITVMEGPHDPSDVYVTIIPGGNKFKVLAYA